MVRRFPLQTLSISEFLGWSASLTNTMHITNVVPFLNLMLPCAVSVKTSKKSKSFSFWHVDVLLAEAVEQIFRAPESEDDGSTLFTSATISWHIMENRLCNERETERKCRNVNHTKCFFHSTKYKPNFVINRWTSSFWSKHEGFQTQPPLTLNWPWQPPWHPIRLLAVVCALQISMLMVWQYMFINLHWIDKLNKNVLDRNKKCILSSWTSSNTPANCRSVNGFRLTHHVCDLYRLWGPSLLTAEQTNRRSAHWDCFCSVKRRPDFVEKVFVSFHTLGHPCLLCWKHSNIPISLSLGILGLMLCNLMSIERFGSVQVLFKVLHRVLFTLFFTVGSHLYCSVCCSVLLIVLSI